MKEKDWTRLLTEDYITMANTETSTCQRHFLPNRVELTSPNTDWSLTWAACRQAGVPPELASFLWLMLHDLLSSQARLHRMGATTSPTCRMQDCPEVGTLQHELLHCVKNDGVGQSLVSCFKHYVPHLHAEAVLRLEFGNIEESLSLQLTLMTAITLRFLWKERELGSTIRTYRVRAEIELYITQLRTTRIRSAPEKLSEMLNLIF